MDLRSTARHARTRIARAARIILRREWAGRNMTVLPEDTFLVSYPRSGNTWLRFLVGNMIHPDKPVTFANVESFLPYVDIHADKILLKAPKPRIMKSHEAFFARYPRVIYIVRDPRDVAVSYYHYLVKDWQLPDGFPVHQFVPLFIKDENFEAKYGPWPDHVMSWIKMRQGTEGFLLLRYEDLLEDTERELGRVAEFLQMPVTEQRLAHAVETSSAAHMRNLETSQWRLWKTTRRSRGDKPFVRSATSGDWKRALSEDSVCAIESAWAPAMRALGYPLTRDGELPCSASG